MSGAAYRRAAKLIFVGDMTCSCTAVMVAVDEILLGSNLQSRYADMFAPPDRIPYWLTGPAPFGYQFPEGEEAKDLRVLMLLLMAAMADAGDV